MFRKKMTSRKRAAGDRVKWRGHEVTRIEAFSDAVFAFAVTLLIVSLEVPKTFDELFRSLLGFLPFGICFLLVFQVWHTQNIFFRRYGMHDDTTVVLNGFLLFFVLFFVYPLKFLFAFLAGQFYDNGIAAAGVTDHDFVDLYYVYGIGFATIYFLFALMYSNAFVRRRQLQLTDSEVFETRTYIYRHLAMCFTAVLSIILAWMSMSYPALLNLAWVPYPLIGVFIGSIHARREKIHRRKFENVPIAVTAEHTVETTLPAPENTIAKQ